jgi:rod shape-determining protein MreB
METLSQTPPELADIYNTGILSCWWRIYVERIGQKNFSKNGPVYIAEDPLRAVVRGTGMALKNILNLKVS